MAIWVTHSSPSLSAASLPLDEVCVTDLFACVRSATFIKCWGTEMWEQQEGAVIPSAVLGSLGMGMGSDMGYDNTRFGGSVQPGLACGATVMCAVVERAPEAEYRVVCVGFDAGAYGLFGSGGTPRGSITNPPTPTVRAAQLPDGFNAIGVAVVDVAVCVWNANGHVVCFGTDLHGVLGNGVEVSNATAASQLHNNLVLVDFATESPVVKIAGAHGVAMYLHSNGDVTITGDNSYNQGLMGKEFPPNNVYPLAPVSELAHIIDVAPMLRGACALSGETGEVLCWGTGDNGRLGQDTTSDHYGGSRPNACPIIGMN